VGAEPVRSVAAIPVDRLTRADRWILARLDAAIADCNAALGPARPTGDQWAAAEQYAGLRLDAYTDAARGFAWTELADWYLESVKSRLADPGTDREVARAVLVHVFDHALRLLHPIVPFVTEALWQRLPGRGEGTFLAAAGWPGAHGPLPGSDGFERVREVVSAVRQLRGEYGIPPGKVLTGVLVASGPAAAILGEEHATIERLTRCDLPVVASAPGGTAAHQVLSDGTEVVLPLAGVIDLEKECHRLRTELGSLEKQLEGLRQRLANESFVARARPDVVEAERRKEQEWSARSELLAAKVKALCGA
jgi:valyl-tRNA synthetase